MHVVILLGSVRKGRKSDRVARYLEDRLTAYPGISVTLLDLLTLDLPIYADRWQRQDDPAPDLVRMGAALAQADALIFVSPEYHGSYTGALKNAVDHYWKEFHRKPIGVVTTGSGRMGGINASIQMQQLVLSLGAYPLPLKLLVPFVDEAFGPDDQPTDPKLITQADRFLEEFCWFGQALVAARQAQATPQP